MCPEITKSEEPAVTTAASAAVKAKPKKVAKKSVTTEKAVRTTTPGLDLAKRTASLLTAMKKLGAVSAGTARTADEIAGKSGLTRFDVYGLCYHAHPLVVDGLVKIAKMEGVRGLSYYLTAKGVKAE